jgi:hypothetical protein
MTDPIRRELERRLEQSRRLAHCAADPTTSQRLAALIKELELKLEQQK